MTTDTLYPPVGARHAIDDEALDQLFRAARTHNDWLDRPVPGALLRQAVDLAKMGPTSANSLPMRVVFVKSAEAKARLEPALAPQNLEKTMMAPVTAIVGYDLGFPELLPRLFPHANARAWFADNKALIADTAYRNGSLQDAHQLPAQYRLREHDQAVPAQPPACIRGDRGHRVIASSCGGHDIADLADTACDSQGRVV